MNSTSMVTSSNPVDFTLRVMRLTLYPLIIFLGILGNVLVCLQILCDKKNFRRPSSRYFVVNLAISDLLVLLMFIPFDLVYLENNLKWIFGQFMCKLVNTLTYMSVIVSGTTLAAISYDRYRAIVHPLRKSFKARTVLVIIVVIWMYAILTLLPFAHSLKVFPTKECVNDFSWWPNEDALKLTFVLAGFVPGYVLPFCFVAISYILIGMHLKREHKDQMRVGMLHLHVAWRRSKQNLKTVRLLTSLVLAFTVCILPHYIVILLLIFKPEAIKMPHMIEVHEFTRLLATANSCINPILYSAVSVEFREGVAAFLRGTRKNAVDRKSSTQSTRASREINGCEG